MVTVVREFKEKIERLAKDIFNDHFMAREAGSSYFYTLISNGRFMGNFGFTYDEAGELVIEANVIKGSREETVISVRFREPNFTEKDYFEYLFFLLTEDKYSYTSYALEDTVWCNGDTYLGSSDVIVSLRLLFNKIGILTYSDKANGTTIRLNNIILGEGELDLIITKVGPSSIVLRGHRSIYIPSKRLLRSGPIEPTELHLYSRDYPQKLYEIVYGSREFNTVNFKEPEETSE